MFLKQEIVLWLYVYIVIVHFVTVFFCDDTFSNFDVCDTYIMCVTSRFNDETFCDTRFESDVV